MQEADAKKDEFVPLWKGFDLAILGKVKTSDEGLDNHGGHED
jgi:hypothetical protein